MIVISPPLCRPKDIMQRLWLSVLRHQLKRCNAEWDQAVRELPLPTSASTSKPHQQQNLMSSSSLHTYCQLWRAASNCSWDGQAQFSSVQQPERCKPGLWPRDGSMLGEKHRTLNPVFSSFKVSTRLWLDASDEATSDSSQLIVNLEIAPLQTVQERAFIWRFHKNPRSRSRRKEERRSTSCKEPQIYCSIEASQGSYLAVSPDIQIFIGE